MGTKKRDDSTDVEHLERHLDEATGQINAASEFIVTELERHVPKPIRGPSNWQDGGWVLHPGNHLNMPIQLWCAACSSSWPCATMNALRTAYSLANGYEVRARLKPAQLTIERETTAPAPTLPERERGE